jgi:hypothetical protein
MDRYVDITEFMRETAGGSSAQVLTLGCPCRRGMAQSADARTYHGSAPPDGKTVVVGGVEVVVGGWASYEATRRAARWRARPHDPAVELRARYGGRTYVSGQDAVESLVTARSAKHLSSSAKRLDPLARSAERLATAVSRFDEAVAQEGPATIWGRLGIPPDAPVAVSTITPEDIRYTVPETDVHVLHRAAEDAGILASGYAREDELPALRAPRPPGALPPMPMREVATRGAPPAEVNGAISRLETAAVPRAAAIEAYRGDVAAVFDAAAAVLERAVDT